MPSRNLKIDRSMVNAPGKVARATAAMQGATAAVAAANKLAGEVAELHRKARGAATRAKDPSGASSAGILPTREGYQIAVSSFSITGRSDTSMRIKGHTVLGSGRVAAANSPNSVAMVAALNPASFSDRLGTQARLYDKYVYHSVKLQYIPSVGTSTNGSVAMYLDRDYADPAEAPDVLQAIMSAENSSMGPCYAKVTTQLLRDAHEKRTYFTNGASGSNDFHETEQFKALAYFVNADTVAAARTLGTFLLTYDLELISPVFAPSEFYNFSNFAYNSGNGTLGGSSKFTNAVPFGFSAGHQFSIIELCLADFAGSTANVGFTWGTPGTSAPAVALSPGMSLYLRRTSVLDNTVAGQPVSQYTVYDNLPDAQALGEKYMFNTNLSATSIFSGAVAFWWRNVGVSRGA